MAPKNQRWWLTEDHVELDIEASANSLYAMVSDLPRIGEWSPECEGVDWEGDVAVPVVGTTFVGHNAVGPGRRIRYTRHGRVLVADPGREFTFCTDEGGRESTVWRYRFEPRDGGRTRVTEGYEVRWIPVWARVLDVPTNRHRELLKGMRTTLERLKAAAEAQLRDAAAPADT
jgi:Polyketide cyclase / dehydrase and lipid transport